MNIRPELQAELSRLKAIEDDEKLKAQFKFLTNAIKAFDGLELSEEETQQLKIYKFQFNKKFENLVFF